MRRFIPLVATLLVIAVNAAANILPINGLETSEVSARHPTGFTPAGWVFSIWSLIYAGLLAFSIYVIRLGPDDDRTGRIIVPFLVSCAANVTWIFLWHHELIGASVVCMAVLLGALVVIYRRLYAIPTRSLAERICVDAPFSLYLGWITTAALANLAALFNDLGVWPFGLAMEEWALLTVVVATGIYSSAGVRTGDPLYTLVFVWAGLGIFLRTAEISEPVRLAAAGGVAVALVVTAVSLGRRFRGRAGTSLDDAARWHRAQPGL